jgi:polysaccharide export outer membrane protein
MKQLFILMLMLMCSVTLAQPLPAGITPQMIDQFKSMPRSQQEALARQYGISLPAGANADMSNSDTLARPGEPLRQDFEDAGWLNTSKDLRVQMPIESDGPTRFGTDIFDQSVSTFAPTDDAPIPNDYPLGVGDQLVVQLFGKDNQILTLQVGRDGEVAFPKLGSILLAGLRFEEARELVKSRVKEQLIGVEAVVNMGRMRAINVFMAGEVEVPGAYSFSAMSTVMQALFQAGGVSEIGSLRNIQLVRQGEVTSNLDVYDLLMRGDAKGDMRLQSGDVVFVPPYKGQVELTGAFKRPMIYELANNETVAEMIKMAGGFEKDAYFAQATLTRTSDLGGLPVVKTLDLSDSAMTSLIVKDGDVLNVPSVGKAVSASVRLTGAVNRPGTYGWTEGMRISDLLRDSRRDLVREVDLSYSLIVRFKNERLDVEVIQFDLGDAITAPGSDKDPQLFEFDEVIVFSLPELEGVEDRFALDDEATNRRDTEFLIALQQMSELRGELNSEDVEQDDEADFSRATLLEPIVKKLSAQARDGEPTQLVSISGAVKAPGTYPLIAGATVADLVAAAGGLKDSAFISSAELRTMKPARDGSMTATYTEVDLGDSLQGRRTIRLSSRDHLTVRDIPDWSPQDAVEIKGEVLFPGRYLIQKGETLADVVERAGGLTVDAFPMAAVFTREEVAKREAERAKAFASDIRQTYASRLLTEETVSTTLNEVVEITKTLEEHEGLGRILIDLPAALRRDAAADVEVTDGDVLRIPKKVSTVTVVGEVQQRGTHTFKDNLSVQDYLALSAGLTSRADDKGIYIVRANGSVTVLEQSWWRFTGVQQQLQPGDTIVVPVNSRYKEALASWREITQIVYQSIVSVAAVARL